MPEIYLSICDTTWQTRLQCESGCAFLVCPKGSNGSSSVILVGLVVLTIPEVLAIQAIANGSDGSSSNFELQTVFTISNGFNVFKRLQRFRKAQTVSEGSNSFERLKQFRTAPTVPMIQKACSKRPKRNSDAGNEGTRPAGHSILLD